MNLFVAGAIGRQGLQGFPGQNVHGPKGIFTLLLFYFITCVVFELLYSFHNIYIFDKGFSGSPGRNGVNGFSGDRGEAGLTGDKGFPGIGFNITGEILLLVNYLF